MSLGAGRTKARDRKRPHALCHRGVAALVWLALGSAPAGAESLREALAAAYTYSPKLDAERARLRATDEDVTRAESGYRPIVEGSADWGRQTATSKPKAATNGETSPWGYSISLRQQVFNGFRTTNEVSEAEASVRAGREDLRSAETNTLLDAVGAYMDVVAAQAVLRIRENNVQVLAQELEAAKTRRAANEVTRTDVAQAQARLARAISTSDLAKSDVKTARGLYERAIGHPPGKLAMPPMTMSKLPQSIEEAWQMAEQQSPAVGSALYREEAARYAVDKIRGELLPEVSVEASYGYRENLNNYYEQQDSASITGRISVPFYDGGDSRARVRQAKEIHVSRLQEIEQARADAQASVTAAWSALMGQRAKLRSDQVQVEANRIALEGVREEQKVGQRTLLDVLNAEQEYLDSQIELVSARREVVVASYRVLGATGQLSAERLGLTAAVYDPAIHLEEARQNWFGVDITHADGRHEVYEVMDSNDGSGMQ
ncbi:MAG TPA: TolC family outer membrane protein [Hyphomicrobium sp.]|nr:TolC family outer membrane protein [Hyphomicrobium sp.]